MPIGESHNALGLDFNQLSDPSQATAMDLDKFEEQDVDLQVFLSLTDNDLKEIGIK